MNYRCDEIAVILEKIAEIQRKAVRVEIREEFCDFGRLTAGEGCGGFSECNTRPIQLFLCCGGPERPLYVPIHRAQDGCNFEEGAKSCALRVEKVQNGAVTLRALKERHECEDPRMRYESTDSFLTVKLETIAAIRCLPDTFVDLCIR